MNCWNIIRTWDSHKIEQFILWTQWVDLDEYVYHINTPIKTLCMISNRFWTTCRDEDDNTFKRVKHEATSLAFVLETFRSDCPSHFLFHRGTKNWRLDCCGPAGWRPWSGKTRTGTDLIKVERTASIKCPTFERLLGTKKVSSTVKMDGILSMKYPQFQTFLYFTPFETDF